MLKQIKELQRQFEISAIVLEHSDVFSVEDLAEKFKVSRATILRDLNSLRSLGASIHSRKRRLNAHFVLKDLNKLLSIYCSINSPFEIRNLKLIYEKFRKKTLSVFVNILKAIREKKEIQVNFIIEYPETTVCKILSPLYLIPANKNLYLIAYDKNDLKYYRLETLKDITLLKTKQSKAVPMLSDLNKFNWGIYSGGTEEIVKLKFDPNLAGYIDEKFWMENQEVRYTDDGIILKLKVKISNEFIAWIMGWGDKVKVISPIKLRNEIINRSKKIIGLYISK